VPLTFKKLNNDLKLKKEQIKIIEKRLGKENIGRAIMDRNPLTIIHK